MSLLACLFNSLSEAFTSCAACRRCCSTALARRVCFTLTPFHGRSLFHHLHQIDRLSKNPDPGGRDPGLENPLPEFAVLFGTEYSGAQLGIDPARQLREAPKKDLNTTPQGLREQP